MTKPYDPKELRALIEETLKKFDGLYSPEAVELLLGTIAQESAFGKYRHQIRGPAHGIAMIEQATFEWLKQKYKHKYPEIESYGFEQLIDSDRMSIVMTRLKYLSIPHPLPPVDNLPLQATYWNRFYNCNPIYGTDEEYLTNYANYVKNTEIA